MKLPICKIDAQTNTLCRKCKVLYREGKISDLDIEISKLLIDLSKSHKELNDVHFYSSIELEDIVILVVREQDAKLLSSNTILQELENAVAKKIRFLKKTNDPKKLVESLISPVPVQNVTVLYIPPFSETEYKVEISEKYKDQLPISEQVLVQTVTSILGTDVYIEYV